MITELTKGVRQGSSFDRVERWQIGDRVDKREGDRSVSATRCNREGISSGSLKRSCS